jgi:hypothetical protein
MTALGGAPLTDRPSAAWARDRRALLALLLVALSPVVAVLVTRVGRSYFPVGDPANIDYAVRQVFTAHPPLVGAYSRGFNHPGPSMFWAIAPLSLVAGGAPWATLVGAALLQGVAIVGVGLLAFRRGGIGLALLVLAALGLVYSGLGQGGPFVVPWNPYEPVPFFLLFLLAVWAVAVGDRWQAVTAVLTGSFVMQAHIGYTPLVLAGLAFAVVFAFVDRALIDRAPRWRPVLGWSALALVVMWIAPLIQQVRNQPGNLRAIYHYFADGGPTVGVHRGAGLLATEFKVLPPWLGGRETFEFGSGVARPSSVAWLLVPCVLLGVGWWCARRSGRLGDRRMVELAALVAVVSIAALARITVDASPYLFYWRIVVAAFVVVASVWAIANWWPVSAHPRARAVSTSLLVVALLVGFVGQIADVVNHSDRVATTEASAEDLMQQVERAGLPHRPVLVRSLGSNVGGVQQGLVDALDRAGAPVRVDPRFAYRFSPQLAADPGEVGEVWYVSEEGIRSALLAQQPGARVVASTSPLSRRDERELQRLQRDAATALTAHGAADRIPQLDSPFLVQFDATDPLPGVDAAAIRRMAALNQQVLDSRDCRCAVIAFPASAPEPEGVSG